MKRLLFIFIQLFFVVSAIAQEAEGVVIPGTIVSTDSLDNYPTHDDWFGRVGFRIVKNLTYRDLIPANRRVEGMLVYVQSTQRYYKLQDCTDNECWIDNRIDTLFGGTHSTGRITVQAKDYDPSFLYDGYTKEGYQRFGVSKNGLLISGRRMPMTINVDGLAIIGDRNDLTGTDAFAFGKDVSALSDSSGAIGYNLETKHYNSMLIGRGKFRTQKLKTTLPNSLGIGYMQDTSQIQLSEDTIRLKSKILWWNDEPFLTGVPFPLSLDNGYFQINDAEGTTFFNYSKQSIRMGNSSEDYFTISSAGPQFQVIANYAYDWGNNYTNRSIPDWENVRNVIKDSIDATKPIYAYGSMYLSTTFSAAVDDLNIHGVTSFDQVSPLLNMTFENNATSDRLAVGVDGVYELIYHFNAKANYSDDWHIDIFLNGSAQLPFTNAHSGYTANQLFHAGYSAIMELDAGDYIDIRVSSTNSLLTDIYLYEGIVTLKKIN